MLNSIIEEWKPIKKLENKYYISNLGKVKNSSNRILKTFINNNGYECIKIYKVISYHFCIHRLVALYFVENNDSTKIEVNHIDGNKLNNIYTNIEWVNYLIDKYQLNDRPKNIIDKRQTTISKESTIK